MSRAALIYLEYLNLARMTGLPPDQRRWDHPCPRFKLAAAYLLRNGLARRRFILFGPLGITKKGLEALWKAFQRAGDPLRATPTPPAARDDGTPSGAPEIDPAAS